MLRRLFDWLDSAIMRFMASRGPRKATKKEAAEILKRKAEYEKWAKEGK